MSYRDKNLTCRECSRHFTFSAGEQALGGELGYDEPRRCRMCQQSREDARRSPIAATASGPLPARSPT